MSEWHVEVVTVGPLEKHPNADSLSITQVHGGYPAIVRTGEVNEGDLAVYIPVDSIVPDEPQFAFLQGRRRVKAKKLRGVYSQGLLLKVEDALAQKAAEQGVSLAPGALVHELMGITKWEPSEEQGFSGGYQEPGPEGWDLVKYTDIEGLRRYKHVLKEGEEVIITEKIHGSCAGFCWDGERLWVRSKGQIRRQDPTDVWWSIADRLQLTERLARFPKTIFFGEVFGKGVQDLAYDKLEKSFIVFDTFDVVSGRWNDWETTVTMAKELDLQLVPVLYQGPWQGFEAHAALAEGVSTLAKHVREGFVVKPLKERWEHMGRVILKLVGEGYNLR